MTKKHFNTIARELSACKPVFNNDTKRGKREFAGRFLVWSSCVERMADVCAAANSNFNRDKFYIACLYSPEDDSTRFYQKLALSPVR